MTNILRTELLKCCQSVWRMGIRKKIRKKYRNHLGDGYVEGILYTRKIPLFSLT